MKQPQKGILTRKYQESPISNLRPITAVMLTIEAVLIILTADILVLFLYYRNAPEIKATNPYLSLTMFFRMLFSICQCDKYSSLATPLLNNLLWPRPCVALHISSSVALVLSPDQIFCVSCEIAEK